MAFGPSMLPGGMTEEDLARLFGRAPMSAPQSFGGTSGTVAQPAPPAPAPAPAPAPLALRVPPRVEPASPAEPAEAGGPVLPDFKPADLPPGASPAVPMGFRPPPRPSNMPSADAVPTAAAAPAPAASGAAPAAPAAPADSEPSFLDKLMGGIRKTDGLLGSLGIGLLSAPTMHEGLAAGLKNHQVAGVQGAATKLAQTELGIKQAKAAREARGENATKAWLTGKGLDENLATAAMSNTNVLQSVMSQLTKDPSRVTIGGNIYELKHGEKPNEANLLGPAEPGVDVIRAKAQAQTEGAAAGKPDEKFNLIPDAERAALGLPAGAYQRDSSGKVLAINPSGTSVNIGTPEKEQDKIVGKGYGEYQIDLATKGRNSASTLNTLSLMEQAMKAPGFYSGVGGEGVKRANQFLGALGVKDSKAASAAEVFDALSNKVVLDGLGGSLGPGISNTDRDYIARTAPTLAQSEQGNRDLIGVARTLAQRQQSVSKLARDYATKNGGRLDAGFDQALEQYAKANPLFPQANADESASAPKEPPQGAPQGARQARDGNWYVPDPNRPGKFMKVQ